MRLENEIKISSFNKMFNYNPNLLNSTNPINSLNSSKNKKNEKNSNDSKVIKIKSLSFSGFSESQVFQAWKKGCISGDYETCCHWAVEIILSKWHMELWNHTILFCAKYIHSQNPKIGMFLHKIQIDYPQLCDKNANEESLRQVIALVSGVICYSPKGILYPTPAINISNMELEYGIKCLEKKNICSEVSSSMVKGDHEILCALLNSCVIHIKNNDLNNALRIIGWIFFLEKSKEHKKFVECGDRPFSSLLMKDTKDWIFFAWDIFSKITPSDSSDLNYDKIIKAWRFFYMTDYKRKLRISRIPIIINVIILLSEKQKRDMPCIYNELVIQKACSNIDKMFDEIIKRQRNKNEVVLIN